MRDVRYQRINGMVLLEVMLAACLSLFLISAMTSLYLKMHHSMLMQQALYRQQAAAETVMTLFKTEVALAGHIGCAKLSSNFTVYPDLGSTITAANYLEVYPDRLIVRYQSLPNVVLIEASTNKHVLVVDKSVTVHRGERLMISDCHHAEIFLVESVSADEEKQVLRSRLPLHDEYNKGAEVGRFVVHDYHLKALHGRENLIRIDDAGHVSSMVKDVKDLSFKADSSGVQFAFSTNAQGLSEKWVGYAEKN